MADIKWTWNFDVYDESDSPTEEGYYRIIDDEGNEMTDYYFNEPKMTPHGVGYWRGGTRPIIAWRFLGKTENSSEIPNNCEVKNYCDDCLYTDTCDSKEFFYACTSKATISKMEQVDKDINVRSEDEPQTDCAWK